MKREWTFPYKKEPSDIVGLIDRPVVEVHLKSMAGNWLRVLPYADSGADFTLFPKSVCKLLGLKLQFGRKSLVGGISGSALTIFIHTIQMRIGEREFTSRVAFANTDHVPYLLGRIDLLEHFDVRFGKANVRFIER